MNKLNLRMKYLCLFIIISCIFMYSNNVFAKVKINEAGRGIVSQSIPEFKKNGKSCNPSKYINAKFERNKDKITIKLSSPCGGDWKAAIDVRSQDNHTQLASFFNDSNRKLDISNFSEDKWKNASDSDGYQFTIKEDSYIQIFVIPVDGTKLESDPNKNGEKTAVTLAYDKPIYLMKPNKPDEDDETLTFKTNGNSNNSTPKSSKADFLYIYESHAFVNSIVEHKNSTKGKKSVDSSWDNPIKNTKQCDAMREGFWYKNKRPSSEIEEEEYRKYQDLVQSNLDDYKAKMQAYFPYCFVDQGPDINFSNKIIKNERHRFMEYYYRVNNLDQLVAKFDNGKYISLIGNYTNNYGAPTFDTKLSNPYKCGVDAKTSETKIKWHDEQVFSNSVCKVSCVEKLTTTYSPPVFTKAGMCFTYKVTVKSKVDCGMELQPDFLNNKWPTNPYNPPDWDEEHDDHFCNPTADCTGNSTDQAGPNEDFEDCINKCDNGKYTEKCSNKCYEEVYGSNTKKENKSESKTNKKVSITTEKAKTAKNINLALDGNRSTNIQFMANEKKMSAADLNEIIVSKAEEVKDKSLFISPSKANEIAIAAKTDKSKLEKINDPYLVYYYEEGEDENGNPIVHTFLLDKYCSTWKSLNENTARCVEAFMHAKTEFPLGKYKKDDSNDGTYEWKKSDLVLNWQREKYYPYQKDPDPTDRSIDSAKSAEKEGLSVVDSVKRSAPYYLSSKEYTESLLKGFFGRDPYRGVKYRTYDIDNKGIKRRHNSSSNTCHDQCYFYSSNDNDCDMDTVDVIQSYDNPEFNNLQKQLKAIKECEKQATENCSTAESTFYISANTNSSTISCDTSNNTETSKANKIEKDSSTWGNSSKKICSYAGTNNTSKVTSERNNKTSGDDIFVRLYNDISDKINGIPSINTQIKYDDDKYLEYQDEETDSNGINGACYGIAKVNNNQQYSASHQYKTTITFPGQYINLKSGEIVVTKINGSHKESEKFCTGFDAKKVNVDWWDSRNRGETTYNGTVSYNIKAKVSNFGRFGWTFDTKCFYAIKNTSGTSDDDDQEENTVLNNEIRVVDPKDVFNTKTNKKRKVGFNWTSKAKVPEKFDNVLNKGGYTVDPQTYLKNVETTAKANTNTDVDATDYTNSKGTYNDKEVDFEAVLTPNNINKVRAYASLIGKFNTNQTVGKAGHCSSGAGVKKEISGYFEPYGDKDSNGDTKLVLSMYHSCILNEYLSSDIIKINKSSVIASKRKNNY